MRTWVRLAVGLACALVAAGCAGGGRFSYDDLPEAPVALVVRSEDDMKRLDEYAKRDAERRAEERSNLPTREGIDRVAEILELTIEAEERRTLFGRLMFLDARERETERAEFATKGARPLSWNADRSRLLFTAERDRRTQVYEWNRETGEVRQMTFGRPHYDATYGPGDQLAVVRHLPLREVGDRIEGGLQIWITGIGGTDARRLTDGPFDVEPTWSPDGKTLVFEHRDVNGVDTLRAVDPEQGGEPVVLGRGRSPVFTPSGEWIVYSARTRPGLKIWRMHPDGSGRRPIGRSAFQEFDPTVSPDGSFVLFIGAVPGSESGPQVLVRDIEGASSRQLSIDGSGFVPVW